MNLETVGYCIMIAKCSTHTHKYETLGYGIDGAPYDTELLRGRGAAIFDSKEAAMAEIKSIRDNPENKWTSDYAFGLLTIHRPVSL